MVVVQRRNYYGINPGLFFGHCEKNSSSEKLKTQAKSRKNSSKIRKKLKNCQLQLGSVGGFLYKPLSFPLFAYMSSIFEPMNLKVHYNYNVS